MVEEESIPLPTDYELSAKVSILGAGCPCSGNRNTLYVEHLSNHQHRSGESDFIFMLAKSDGK